MQRLYTQSEVPSQVTVIVLHDLALTNLTKRPKYNLLK